MNKTEYIQSRSHVAVTPGESVRIVRELQNMSQNVLAKLTGISQSNISAIENCNSQLGRDRAIVLAKVLKVHPAVLLFPDFDMHEAS